MSENNVVVTGGASGLGKAIVDRLSRSGQQVFSLDIKNKMSEDNKPIEKNNIIEYHLDVTNSNDIKSVFQNIEDNYGPIEILINCAGIYALVDFWEQDIDEISRIIDVNLKGTLFCIRNVLPFMLKRKSGRIINISSVAGIRGIPKATSYCASKYGIVGLSEALAQELLPNGILLNTICPGAMDTPLWREGKVKYPGDIDKIMAPEDVAELVHFIINQKKNILYKNVILFPTNEWY